MPKRFNNLNAALKYLRKPGANDGTQAPEAPKGSQLAQYQDWKAGKIEVNYTRDNGSKPGAIDELILKPFALSGGEDDNALIGISRRAKEGIAATGLTFTDLNVAEPSASKTANRIAYFQPAKAIVTIYQATSTSANSKITGRPYKKKGGNSYTLPFGKKNATDTYAEAKTLVLSKVSVGNTQRGVSFDAEIYR